MYRSRPTTMHHYYSSSLTAVVGRAGLCDKMGKEQLRLIRGPGAPKGENRLSPECLLIVAGHNGMTFTP
ncbi:hypothetical protein TNCV_2362051 [Trichonephila clavipes]|nr:hypothetical protein TNCV_2362051 [Trichonephila clavipes]